MNVVSGAFRIDRSQIMPPVGKGNKVRKVGDAVESVSAALVDEVGLERVLDSVCGKIFRPLAGVAFRYLGGGDEAVAKKK